MASYTPTTHDPDDALPTRELAIRLFGVEWLTTPNTAFYGQAPEEWIGTDYEPALRNRIFNAKYGCFS
jgi:hypothetical protein